MILFFANNRASKAYFEKIAAIFPAHDKQAAVYKDGKARLPDFSCFKLPVEAFERHIHAEAIKKYHDKNKKLPSLITILLALWTRWQFACDSKILKKIRPEYVVVWNGLMFRRSIFVAVANDLGIPVIFMENGLLPNTTVCDPKGINAVNSVPRDMDFYINRKLVSYEHNQKLVVREAKVEKKATGAVLPEKFIFVPFQVDTDSQILLFSDWIQSMETLFNEIVSAAEDCPDVKFVFKEHPSSPIDYQHLHPRLPAEIGVFANEYNTQELIEKSEGVITINSTVGIEALLLGKKVIVLGKAFYNIPGLVLTAHDQPSLLSAINELIGEEFNEKLRLSFIDYLQEEYLVKGSWKEASPGHCEAVAQRIIGYANG